MIQVGRNPDIGPGESQDVERQAGFSVKERSSQVEGK